MLRTAAKKLASAQNTKTPPCDDTMVPVALLILVGSARSLHALSQPSRMVPLPSLERPSSVAELLEPLPGPAATTDVVFLGTGGSSGTPHLHCLLATRDTSSSAHSLPCETCKLALEGDPRHNKNFRGNPSLLIRHRTANGVENVLIDAGKVNVSGMPDQMYML